jgi:hypothetical protein
VFLRPNKALLLSLLIHAGALGLFIFARPDLVRVEKPVDRIWMEVVEENSAEHFIGHSSQSLGQISVDAHRSGRRSTPSVKIQDLGIRYGWEVGSSEENGQKNGPKNGPKNSNGAIAGSRAQGVLDADAKLPLYHYVYDRINGNLAYPMELVAKKIAGSVSGVLVFSDRGEFLEDHSRLSGDSSFLKVAVVRAVRRAFRDGIPSQFLPQVLPLGLKDGQSLEVSCRFVFEIIEHEDETLVAQRQGIVGREMDFYRSFEESALQWQLGPLSGLGPFASLDVTWFPRPIGDLLSKKAKFDPLDSYRDDAAW